MNIVTLKEEQFEMFASKHKYRNYFQTVSYAKIMLNFGYDAIFIGITNDNKALVGASLIIYKKVFMNKKIGYAPRGILFDYDNIDNVNELAETLKTKLSKQGFMLLKMDPYIPLTVRNKENDIINFNNIGNTIIDNLNKSGFTYKGKTLFFEGEHPRWEALLLLNKDIKDIFENFDKKTRNKIRKAITAGIDVELDKTKDVSKIYEFSKSKNKMPLKYYEEFKKEFGDDVDIYYAKINTSTFVINSRRTYEKEQQINAELALELQDMSKTESQKNTLLNKKMESDRLLNTYKNTLVKSTEMLKKYPKGIVIAGCMVLSYDNVAYIVEDAVNDEYAQLNANYLLFWRLIEEYKKKGRKYINLNAVVGEFEKKNKYSGLNEMKLSFNSVVTEYVGEFEIILNKFAYSMYQNIN